MQKHFSRVRATDPVESTGRRAGRYFGLLVAGVLIASHALSVSASAQTATPAFKPNAATQEQKIGSTPQTEEEWRKAMSLTPPAKKGCFTAAYPKMEWTEVQCVPVSGGPHYPAQGTASGNNNSFIAISTGGISQAIGTFDSVTGATSVSDSMSGADKFSLQLNTNFFPSRCALPIPPIPPVSAPAVGSNSCLRQEHAGAGLRVLGILAQGYGSIAMPGRMGHGR